MVIIDFKHTHQQAFSNGFQKGLAAPLMLFGQFAIPPVQEVANLPLPNRSDAQALANDWQAIGADFNNAITQYGQENHSK